uniref:Uncharacterized protein n=1 Tax=Ciona intestinalis TaxID=7719 RepID=H2XNR1_CIOIN
MLISCYMYLYYIREVFQMVPAITCLDGNKAK